MKHLTHYILLVLALAVGLSTISCSDEEKFTTSAGALLSFSKDTISFDTVFTTIGTSTKSFQVYNRNSEGLHLTNVRLGSGGKSGFRMNVDGQYGASINDVDVLKNDSIFIFVEATVNPQDADSPILIEDSIIFTMQSGLSQRVLLRAYGQDIIVLKNVRITEETTLCSPRPYVIYDSLVVDSGKTLHIGAGSTLCFHADASLKVRGILDVQGTYDNPVTIRGDRIDKIFYYLPYDRLDSQWQGITFYKSSKGNTINCADIHSGTYGIMCEGADPVRQLTISNTTIHNVAGYGLEAINSNILASNCQITNALCDCILLTGGTYEFYHCTIGQFYPWNVDRGSAVYCIHGNEHPLNKANFYNSIITGYADDEIYVQRENEEEEKTEATPFNILFDYCLVNTDTTGSSQYFTNCIIDHKDSTICKAGHFKTIDTKIYYYDFSLDSLSTARGKAGEKAAVLYPLDKNGKARSENANLGCYE